MDWKDKIDEINMKHINNIKTLNSSEVVYHYTSPTGLMGIFNSSSLWFSDSDYLNDASESYYFYQIFNEVYNAVANNNTTRRENKFVLSASFITMFHSGYLGHYRQTSDRQREYRYILSLSTDQDNINLWNYYTKTPGNIGYCIGFEIGSLLESIKTNCSIIHGKVIYSKRNQLQYLKSLVNDYWDIYKELKYTYQREYLYSKMEHNLVVYSVFMKDSRFKYENEYRIAVVTTETSVNNRSFREVNGSFVPYIVNEFNLGCINKIGVSPTNKVDFAKKSIKEFAESKGIKASVFNSTVPLRY